MYGYSSNREMVQKFIKKEALRLRMLSHDKMKNITTLDEWLKEREYIRLKLLKSLGDVPEKTELNPVTINRIEKKEYYIENISLESLPGIQINLNLYLPNGLKKPISAVIFATGHSSKVHPDHQYPVQGLVRQGYAVATFDCFGRGERAKGNEHFEVGPLCWLNGNNMNRYFINDSIRVVDYLLTRDEIDKEKIGCTGISGGGNTTIFHAALDERVKCAVPACTSASFSDYFILNYYSACPEYYPSGLLGCGIDIQDIICLIAPRPFMFIGGGKDVINIMPSLKEACEHAEKIYELFGAKDNISYFIDEQADHSYSLNMRKRMYGWMDSHIGPYNKENYKEDKEVNPEILEKKETVEFLACFKSNLLGYENNILKDNIKKWKTNLRQDAAESTEILKKLLGLSARVVKYNKSSCNICKQGFFTVEETVIETDEEIYVPIVIVYPSDRSKINGAVLVLTDEGKDKLLSPHAFMEYVENGCLLAAADLRGIGDSRFKNMPWDHYVYCSADRAVSGASFVIGYPVLGQQVYDALAVLKFLNDIFSIKGNIKIIGEGHSGIIAKLISLLVKSEVIDINCGLIPYVNLFNPEIAHNSDKTFKDLDVRRFRYKYCDIIPGILQYFDL